MSRKRRSFTTKYKVDAAHRVIDSGRSIAEVGRDLGLNEGPLGRWVADERRRLDAAQREGDEPLTAAERDELTRLRRQVADQEMDIDTGLADDTGHINCQRTRQAPCRRSVSSGWADTVSPDRWTREFRVGGYETAD
jgi:transposase